MRLSRCRLLCARVDVAGEAAVVSQHRVPGRRPGPEYVALVEVVFLQAYDFAIKFRTDRALPIVLGRVPFLALDNAALLICTTPLMPVEVLTGQAETWLAELVQSTLQNNELLEISVVAIPANPRAVALAYKAGDISKKDATWLMKSMREEADFIEKQLEATKSNMTEKTPMDEPTAKQLSAVLDAMTNIVSAQATTNKRLDDVTTVLAETRSLIKEKGAVARRRRHPQR